MKPSSQWTVEEIEDEFNLLRQMKSDYMQAWLTSESVLTESERKQLERLREQLERRVYTWNEQELTVYFIGRLLEMVNFDQEEYHSFLGREISATYQNETLASTVDFVVAQGEHSPKHPYFFIHEYKKEHDSSNDPLGQLLVAMVAAQLLNQDDHPLYGAYIIGRYWHFVLLNGIRYTVNPGFNAAKQEIENIYGVLKNTKVLIDDWVSQYQQSQ